MKSAIGILTYRRKNALETFLNQVLTYCPGATVAVFEDCGQTDETEAFLLTGAKFLRRDDVMEADVYQRGPVTVFLSHVNAGVTGNSNKAIRWFEQETDCDHLCLCNDDLEASGPFYEAYAIAHQVLGVGLLCHCDFEGEAYRWASMKLQGIKVKLLTRMTGIMMSMTRQLVKDIGYYEEMLTFGQEHVDYTHRARLAGHVNLVGKPQYCLDVECPTLKHQEVPSSLTDSEKASYYAVSDPLIEELGQEYNTSGHYRNFSTGRWSFAVGGRYGMGIPHRSIAHFGRAKDSQLENCDPIKVHGPTLELVDEVSAPVDSM